MTMRFNRQLQMIQEDFDKLRDKLTMIHQNHDWTTDNDLEQLVRLSQAAAIACRELWAARNEEIPLSYRRAPASAGAITEGWRLTACSADVVEIHMPLLLPKRRCPNIQFITEPLNLLLSAYSPDLPVFRECVVLFQHIYGPELRLRDVRDHDNLESRCVLNVIERYLLTSDSGIYCTNIHQTTQGAFTGTMILVSRSLNHLEGRLAA